MVAEVGRPLSSFHSLCPAVQPAQDLSLCCPQAGLDNEEQRVGAEIVRRALPYSLKLIARNAGTNGSVVVQKVLILCSEPCRRHSMPYVFINACWAVFKLLARSAGAHGSVVVQKVLHFLLFWTLAPERQEALIHDPSQCLKPLSATNSGRAEGALLFAIAS